jgi:hypothetical protein
MTCRRCAAHCGMAWHGMAWHILCAEQTKKLSQHTIGASVCPCFPRLHLPALHLPDYLVTAAAILCQHRLHASTGSIVTVI